MISRMLAVFTRKSTTNHFTLPRLPACQSANPFQKIVHSTRIRNANPPTCTQLGTLVPNDDANVDVFIGF